MTSALPDTGDGPGPLHNDNKKDQSRAAMDLHSQSAPEHGEKPTGGGGIQNSKVYIKVSFHGISFLVAEGFEVRKRR